MGRREGVVIAKGVERASGVLQSFYFSGGLPGWKFITFPYKKLKSKKEQGKVILEIAWRDNSFQKLCFQGKTGGEWARAIFFFLFSLALEFGHVRMLVGIKQSRPGLLEWCP